MPFGQSNQSDDTIDTTDTSMAPQPSDTDSPILVPASAVTDDTTANITNDAAIDPLPLILPQLNAISEPDENSSITSDTGIDLSSFISSSTASDDTGTPPPVNDPIIEPDSPTELEPAPVSPAPEEPEHVDLPETPSEEAPEELPDEPPSPLSTVTLGTDDNLPILDDDSEKSDGEFSESARKEVEELLEQDISAEESEITVLEEELSRAEQSLQRSQAELEEHQKTLKDYEEKIIEQKRLIDEKKGEVQARRARLSKVLRDL